MMEATHGRINSLKRRARTELSANSPVLTGDGNETILDFDSKHTMFQCALTMPKDRVNFKQTFVWFFKYGILLVMQVGTNGLGQSSIGTFTGMMAAQNNWPAGT